ncbi:hypothetical protein CK203_048191 [Vitis vinifera]|uniref:DUF4283 domain-containing protein n=1 Tax=Vitis vinifera TaxID=29760 RepID=A0A438H3M7_VITVI|nr:hypothetical protein CK203_048191 [Vitis vinifera]
MNPTKHLDNVDRTTLKNFSSKRVRGFVGSKAKKGSLGRRIAGGGKETEFVVESKLFEVETEERNGKRHVVISESKGELVSWVRLGPASVGLVLEGLSQCLRNGEEGRWEKGWKEKGRFYSMVREANRAGCFIRLGVTDMEKRRFGICIPRGGKEKGGWLAVKEALRREGCWLDEKESDQGVRESGKLYAEVVKGSELSDTTRFKSGDKGGGNKEQSARAWGLRGKLGLARLGKGCALLEFEKAEEAEKGENRKEAWVRIVGLPISLWVPVDSEENGRGVRRFLGCRSSDGEEGGHGMGKDQSKAAGRGIAEFDGDRGGGEVYAVTLWWEILPEIRKKKGDGRDGCGRQRGRLEVRKNHARVACGRKSERCTQGTAPVRRWDGKAGGGWLGQTRVQKNGMDYGDGLGLKLEEEFIKCREKEANGMPAAGSPGCGVLFFFFYFFWSDSGEGVLRPLWGNKGGPPEGKQDGARSLGGPSVSREDCWDLIEINSDALEVQNPECTSSFDGVPGSKEREGD